MLIIINQGAQPLRTYLICRSEGSVLYSALQIGFVLLAYSLRKPIGIFPHNPGCWVLQGVILLLSVLFMIDTVDIISN